MTATENNSRTVLITGASSGIGFGVAKAFLDSGANVVLNARNESKLAAAASELGHPDRIAIVPGDIGLLKTGQRMVDVAVERFGRADVLVNNAGQFEAKPFTDYTEEDLDGFLHGVLKGTFLASQAVVPQMRKQGGGAIVNITSFLAIHALNSVPASATSAAKGGVNSITGNLAVELAPDNIRVNAVAPGVIRTPIHGLADEELNKLGGLHPLGRVGEIKDIVNAVLYFADAEFTTGVVMPVDGGVSAGNH